MRISDAMSGEFVLLPYDAPLTQAIRIFLGTGAISIVAREGKILGVVTREDFLELLSKGSCDVFENKCIGVQIET
jgi:predicted transcriptional regulator